MKLTCFDILTDGLFNHCYMTHAHPNLAALVIGLVALSMLSCGTPSRKPAAKVQLAPVGTFVGPAGAAVVKVRLNADGTYIAQDLAEPRYSFIAEGRTLFPQILA